MDILNGQSKKGLLLVSHPKVFEAVEAALGEVGCHVVDDLEAVSEVDLVVMDSFYLKSGTADFIKSENERALTLLVMLENNPTIIQDPSLVKIDDSIVLEPHKSHEDLLFLSVDWLRNAWRSSFASLLSKEFGTGLWVSVMFRLTMLSGIGNK